MINDKVENVMNYNKTILCISQLSESDKYHVFSRMFRDIKRENLDSEFINKIKEDTRYEVTTKEIAIINQKLMETLVIEYEDKLQKDINLIFGEMKRESRKEITND